MGKLTAVGIKNANPGTYQDGEGLFLVRTKNGGRWMYRYSRLAKRRDMGLGSYPAISLSDARKARDKWRVVLNEGKDPIDVRRDQQEAQKQSRDQVDPTFRDMTMTVFEAIKPTLRGEGKNGRWLSPFETHLFKRLGSKRGSELKAADFKEALQPIWRTKWPTAEKAYQRSRLVLAKSQRMGLPVNPLIVEQAAEMLGVVMHEETPTPSTPWQEIPALYERMPDTVAGKCLRFMILTVVRLDGCAGALAEEFERDVWTVPKERVKGREGKVQDFRCPLSQAAQELISEQLSLFDDVLFPGTTGAPISDRALELCLDGIGEAGRPHGFRASFRTWAEDTACAWEVSETILGHKIGKKVERSYKRTDLLDRRRPVMEAWARFVTGQEVADVVPINDHR